MLDPGYLDRAADMVGAVYSEIEVDMLSYLCGLLLDQDLAELGQRGATAVQLLSQSAGPRLLAFVEAHRGDVSRAVATAVEDAIERSDRADAARLARDAGEAMAATRPRQVALTEAGIAAILERDNVDMAQGALDLWNRTVTRAVTRVNTGAATADTAVHAAVREMMREGISAIAYRDPDTGRHTVTNHVDVAVRRHVRTQIAQDGMRRTLEVCGEAGVRLVEVSSHGGARPSHARWQGRVYSLDGEVEVDGVTYRDFYAETGYGSVDGLGGANCRHSFGPWLPGTPRMYDPAPAHPSGLPDEEVYRLTQGQRRRERDIRRTKRELAGAQLVADRDASLANVAEVERLKARLRRQQEGLRRHIDEANARGSTDVLQRSPNREWAGDMPRIRRSNASRRTMGEFMDSDGVGRALKARGVSKATARKALSEEVRRRGMEPRDFSMLSRTNQQAVFKAALPHATPVNDGHRQFRKIKGSHDSSGDLAAVNPSFNTGDPKWTQNCQRCVPAYEMRRRGYDVVAKPRKTDEGGGLSRSDHVMAGWTRVFKGASFRSCEGNGKAECDALMERWGDGSRAEVYVKWRKAEGMKQDPGSHVFIAENRGGEVTYLDPQTGQEGVEGYFEKAESGRTMIARIDNLHPSRLIDECCTSRKGDA